MKNKFAAFFLLALTTFFASPAARAGEAAATNTNLSRVPARAVEFIRTKGPEYGLVLGPGGQLLYQRINASGRIAGETAPARVLPPQIADKVYRFFAAIPKGEEDTVPAQALKSYLVRKPSVNQRNLLRHLFLKPPDGRIILSRLGKNVLMDIITAEDAQLFEKLSEEGLTNLDQGTFSVKTVQWAGGAAEKVAEFSGKTPAEMFDGGMSLGAFDWDSVETAGAARQMGSVAGNSPLSQYYENNNTLRVMIAAPKPLQKDYLTSDEINGDTALKVLREAGLDTALFDKTGAKLVRTTDNILTVEVPLSNAAALGKGLQQQGIESRPSYKLYKTASAAADAIPDSPLTRMFAPFLPVSNGDLGKLFGGNTQLRQMLGQNLDASLNASQIKKMGQEGKGTIVGVIDSGLDTTHPDFKGRVIDYFDFTNEGKTDEERRRDELGHGTHVAGILGGTGEASGGAYEGLAPQTKFVVFKVFNSQDETSEDTILAAMKKAESLPVEIRPQVINMSLGNTDDPNSGLVATQANKMMVKDNIMMVVSAGNEGPEAGSVSSPGNARYVLTVTGTDWNKKFPDEVSSGPVFPDDGKPFNKPDITAISGGVNPPGTKQNPFSLRSLIGRFLGERPVNPDCAFAPGVISASSSQSFAKVPLTITNNPGMPEYERIEREDLWEQQKQELKDCTVQGNPNYRYESGTSMAAPQVAGMALNVISYLRSKGVSYDTGEVKALMMETATDLKQPRETQGAGMVNGGKMASALKQRVELNVPVGNVAYVLMMRLTTGEMALVNKNPAYSITSLGILDKKTGHLISTESEMEQLRQGLKTSAAR